MVSVSFPPLGPHDRAKTMKKNRTCVSWSPRPDPQSHQLLSLFSLRIFSDGWKYRRVKIPAVTLVRARGSNYYTIIFRMYILPCQDSIHWPFEYFFQSLRENPNVAQGLYRPSGLSVQGRQNHRYRCKLIGRQERNVDWSQSFGGKFDKINVNKTGVINDPLGQTHSLASREHCFVLLDLWGRTDDMCKNDDPYCIILDSNKIWTFH